HLKICLVKNTIEKTEQIVVNDLNSKNGIFVNGSRVYEQELTNGDKLKIGDTILKFEIKDRLDVSYHDKLYRQATRDPLTGLSNRNHFQNELRKFISIGLRYTRPFSVMMLDIDFFKSVNDTYGHDVGDGVLKTVAGILLGHVRNQDVAARFGGEEFVILLPETPLQGALAVAERIRAAVESNNFESVGCRHQVTISIGVGEFPTASADADELIKRADESLYKAKALG